MERSRSAVARVALLFVLTACRYAPAPSAPEGPPAPEPTTFPVTEVSGTLPGWQGGARALTLAAGLDSDFDGRAETVTLVPPTLTTTLSAQGTFTVPLGTVSASERAVLACGDQDVALGVVFTAVVSTVPRPARPEEVLGVFVLRSPVNPAQQAVWLYADEALALDARCVPPDAGTLEAELDLVPGWNQAVLTGGEQPRLESRAVPASFAFAEF